MKKQGHIAVIFLLLGALLSTQGMQYVHLFGDHQDERQCEVSKLHFHESEPQCAFHFLYTEPFVEQEFFIHQAHLTEVNRQYFSFYTSLEGLSIVAIPSLRGPPLFFDTALQV